MKDRIIEGVKIACEKWERGGMDFEEAVKFVKFYADDPAITESIARETMNHFRTTRDLEKTMAAIMVMRKARFDRLQKKGKTRATLNLTIMGSGKTTEIDL